MESARQRMKAHIECKRRELTIKVGSRVLTNQVSKYVNT